MACPDQNSSGLKPTNLQLYQGDDFIATVTVSNADGSPADLTGCTAKAQIRKDVADKQPSVATEFTTSVQSPVINISLTHEQTLQLNGDYVWDLQITDGSGAITTILAGGISVTQEVTRDI